MNASQVCYTPPSRYQQVAWGGCTYQREAFYVARSAAWAREKAFEKWDESIWPLAFFV